MNGSGTFNPQILVDKLSKLNSSQQSIETLSHWCIFHRKKARQVVETWDRQYHHSPRDQRLSFLYLANDILQNSRRKGAEFVAEFWKVLPDALNDVIEKGDDAGRKAALRLVDIWEDRKVFGSRGHVLKEELLGRNSDIRNSSGRSINYKLKHPTGESLEKIISSYEQIYHGPVDEEALFGRCRTAITSFEKMKEMHNNITLGNISGSDAVELKEQHNILRDCVEQLKIVESVRASLQSHLREALHEQDLKIEQVHNLLQVVLSQYEHATNICQQLQITIPSQSLLDPNEAPLPPSDAPPGFHGEDSLNSAIISNKQEPIAVRYTQQQHDPLPTNISPRTENEQRKNTAAEVAAKLTASTSSAQMLSYVLSSLASEGIIGSQSMKEDYSSDSKRPKVDDNVPPYVPSAPPPPPPPFPHPDSINPPPPPPPLPPPTMPLMPPLMPGATAPQFIPGAGPMMGMPYSFGSSSMQLPPLPLPTYPMVGIPPYSLPQNPFQGLPMPEGASSLSQPPLSAAPPISRQ
ncbi:hypothetical protein AXF42_Ash003899 [Apostasia shenzhenica]|uniref:CID domain-containing protein n=1 Tax=Apostasia shenzhenica TaxID=1088818 RepID=A0A2I0AI78_9ASPA|nr:hypothetical protein AXF42_Ash003899 [Apostasia shenzhenica]